MRGEAPGAWPLTGRDSELRAIGQALRETGGVLLAGAAGVGKTRLARAAALAWAHAVRWVCASESSRSIPLGAFVPVLGEDAPNAGGAGLLGHAHLALGNDPDLLLVVDDAHLLDAVSATLLHQLVVAGCPRVLLTVRDGERAPDAVTALWKDGLVGRVELAPLALDEVGALLDSVLGGRLDPDGLRRLHAATGGNVLWLRHLVEGERAAGRLTTTDGVWGWSGEPRLTPALTALIDARLGDLPDRVRAVLELLAVGEPIGVPLLVRLAGENELDEAAHRGLVVVEGSCGRLQARLAHPLYGAAVRDRAGPFRARRLRGILADALAATGPGGAGDTLRRAVLAIESDRGPDVTLMFDAALEAAVLSDLGLAERLARAACVHGGGFASRLLLAVLLGWQFRGQDAEREFAAAAGLATIGDERIRVATARATNLFVLLGRLDDAWAELAAAERDSGTPQRGLRAFLAAADNRLAEAEREARHALAARPGAPAEAQAAWSLTAVLALRGRSDQLADLVVRGAAAATRAPETAVVVVNIAYWEILGHGLAGSPDHVQECLGRWSGLLAGVFPSAFRPQLEGWLALVRGQTGAATELLARFRPHFPGHGGGWTTLFETTLAMACAMSGDAAGATEAVRRAEAGRHPGITVGEPLLALARAWTAAAEGAVSVGTALARRAAALAAASGQAAVEVLARHAAVGLGDRSQAGALRELAGRVHGPRAPAAARHAEALAAGDTAALLASSSAFEEAGLLLPAAEAAAQAVVQHRARGEHPAATAAARRVMELSGRCPGAATPALVAAARPLPITEREREIATLVAGTLSNRQIASRLGISVRTVEGHIYRACTKLGVTDRAALAAVVAGPAPGRTPPGGRSHACTAPPSTSIP
ncbi:LuxR C-terminal-related transcriptional regulator [Pseudonocardia hispaniensis]|uniref:LuxR C-terminal-related transcriptional regulator n=1 Tax=Pseudonocardia hispaniensis TaxID=904933 RepID=A0ABW1J5N4_9PSEU